MTTHQDIRESLKTFLSEYPSSSRVWIYQSSRALSDEEVGKLEEEARDFAKDWSAHGKQLDGTARVVYNRFLILIVNPSVENPSGCSIDESVRFVQAMEQKYNTQFFDRLNVALHHEGNITAMPMAQVKAATREKTLPSDALIFDNSLTTLGDLRSVWLTPAYDSWLMK